MTNAIKEYDKETGLYYCNARMYDPKIARFLQEDTYTGDPNDPLSLNLYTYCHNEPIMYTDPTGHWRDVAEKEYASRKWDTDDFQRVEALSNLWKKLNDDLKGYKEGTSRYAEIKALRDSYNDESNKIRSKYNIGPSIPTKETAKIQPTSVKNNNGGCTISANKSTNISTPEFLYDPAKDSGLSISRQNKLADLTIEWYNATDDRDKSATARIIDSEREAANDDAIKESIKGHVEYAINSLVGGGLGTAPILNEMGMSEEALAQKSGQLNELSADYIYMQLSVTASEGNSVVLYHGTSSNKASKIVVKGFRNNQEGIFLADDPEVAKHFANEKVSAESPGANKSLIRIEMSESVYCEMVNKGYIKTGPIGEYNGRPFVDIGNGKETVVKPEGAEAFNKEMLNGNFKVNRFRINP